jgi:hypothetical protein
MHDRLDFACHGLRYHAGVDLWAPRLVRQNRLGWELHGFGHMNLINIPYLVIFAVRPG